MTSSRPAVSIVLPVYNGERFVGEAIDSCLAQTFADWELVTVDDCSSDRSPAILTEYAARDPRIVIVRNTENLKLPKSLNVGFSKARGRYFTWMSDDNHFRPHALQAMVDVLVRHPVIDVVYTDYSVIDGAGAVVATRRVSPIENIALINCVGASFLYRREVHAALDGYDETKPLVEDYDFWLRAARRFRFEPLAVDVYEYRLHEGSLSSQYQARIVAAHRALLREALPQLSCLDRASLGRAWVHLARETYLRGELAHAIDDLWLGCRLAPGAVMAACVSRVCRGVWRRAVA